MPAAKNALDIGHKAPSFTAPTDTGENVSLSDYAGKTLVLYFYPKDDTPGCTKEACGFNESLAALKKLKTAVIGVSKDSVASHQKFKEKFGLQFPLISDTDGKICEAYGTWMEKSMYGRKYMGIDRATFVIGPDGKIKAAWRGVKVTGHIDAVIEALKG
jgi:peroxiredoxin Q/BCP